MNRTAKSGRFAQVAAIAAFLSLGAAAPALAQMSPVSSYDAPTTVEVVVAAGKSQVIELPAPYSDVMIANPEVADVLPLSTRSIYVVGKALGSTALTVYGPGKRLIAAANVVVSADIEGFKNRLHDVLPNERDIAIHPANQSLVVSGTVTSPAALQQVLALAESYAPTKVVNMLGVEGTQQVMLSVRFVEMQRSTAKGLKLNVNRSNWDPALGPRSGASRSGDDPYVSVFTGDTNVLNGGLLVESFGAVAALYNGNLEVLLDALETKGLVRTLAEPNLVAMSGDTASFLAGGEFPIPVAQQSGTNGAAATITVEFKQFGVALAFTPTLLKDGLINLVVNPEVSSIDPTVSIDLGTIKIPGIKVRRARTTVELRDGESFTIAGLLKEDYQSQMRGFPFVSDMPILGALFRSNGYKREETELVIVVTPHLVTPRRGQVAAPGDSFVPPSDFELFLFGSQQGAGARVRPEDRALMSADPTKGGVEGAHGHVLY
ncbi:type II and III secretion system protein family protein [Phenylobacterium sp.]|uniref:type II and III secretion system protein family protein n=1 Tax=Phenylobacterium sp. TaxID=1871053 RepID=UPI00273713D5|nr:type II and III secretion system protein family protein [Phenylobacterium sp.]MDP3852254.1 type II and III secretion system protein family protein [Phenylobacterium sp.]